MAHPHVPDMQLMPPVHCRPALPPVTPQPAVAPQFVVLVNGLMHAVPQMI